MLDSDEDPRYNSLGFVKFHGVENILESHLKRGVPESILIGL